MRQQLHPTVMLVGFFIAANLLGVAAGLQLQGAAAIQQASSSYQSAVSGAVFFGILLLSTVLLLGLYRYNKQLLVKGWFGAAILLTSLVLFDAFLPLGLAMVLTAVVGFLRFRTDDMFLRNGLDTIPFAGSGALFGSLLGFQAVLVFTALLAVYDYIAVNRIGHMVTLAEAGTSSGTFMGFQYPKEAPEPGPKAGGSEGSGTVQVGVLGGGDVVMPIMFAVAAIPFFGVGAAVSIVAGSAVALFAFLTVIQGKETDRFYPAIPVVGSGAVFGLVLFLLVSLV